MLYPSVEGMGLSTTMLPHKISKQAYRSLHALHSRLGPLIQQRLSEFAKLGRYGSGEEIFVELCYCIFAAGASARMAMRAVELAGTTLVDGSERQLVRRLEGRYRYWRMRSKYVVATRKRLRKICGLRIREWLQSMPDAEARRDALALDSQIKGVGYKAASQFLRNIGYRGYAILDKHIVRTIHEFGWIPQPKPPTSRRAYLELEECLRSFARSVEIDFDELDLLLWARRTGEVLK